ncbi:discoidin domain-containing protein [Cohnella terricola]|uniref:Discoidin domain-containing protein n=1 Tax=Cohnella terricola TaxID=1289167 RepID=A0A559JKL4_9BACL|nr:discoidin domain-containing protein [Cohnella terricola]TVY00404.1 discoidin domain-containing protein [Cohnella terricola]
MRVRHARTIWITAGAVLVLLAAVAYFFLNSPLGAKASFKSKDGLLVVSRANLEMAFRSDNGAIAYLKNKASGQDLTLGNRESALWWAFLEDDSFENGQKAQAFSYDWSSRKGELTLHYDGQIKVDVTAQFAEDNRIYLQAKIDNQADRPIKSFRFPYELKVESNGVKDALLPMLPGVKLRDAFFKESNSFQDQYPGVMFASYLGLRTSGGELAVFDLNGAVTATTELGFKNQVDDKGKTGIVHNYKTWIEPKKTWSSPTVVLETGDYEATIASYRELNKIDEYRSLNDKLGDKKTAYFELPFYKTDISAIKDGSWSNLTTNIVDKMNYNGVIHLVGFQKGGHDENYPDFMPPDPQWGGQKAFQAFIQAAKSKGNLVVPYTNMSWWGDKSPTLAKLPEGTTMEDLIVLKDNKQITKEDYGKHSGYVVNTGHPFFLQRIAEEHQKLLDGGFDGIFEDQWGIRNSPYEYNATIPDGTDPSNAYFKGVRNYVGWISHKLYMEDGTDVLADGAVGFMGSNYLWDQLGYRKNTATYADYYPMSGMLLRDKVMQYQHDLAAETMTDDPDMLRWNLAMGYNLSADFFNGVANPWIDMTAIMQKNILSQYGDSLVKKFEDIASNVTRTDFGTYAVTANWSKDVAFVLNEATLPPGGYEVSAADGSRRAGSYSRLNGLDLDQGEHHLIEIRGKDTVRVYQPIGADTTLRIAAGKDWPHAVAAAYQANGAKIADLMVKEEPGYAEFDYVGVIKGTKIAYVELSSSKEASKATATFEKIKAMTNIALGAKAFATSKTADAFPPELTVDGDPYTYWESTAKQFPQSLTLDLGEEKPISKLILRLPPQDAWEARDQTIEVLVSADGESFTSLLAPKAYTFDPKQENVVEISLGDAKARFIRLTITDNTGWPAAQISEFEVY